MRYAYTKSMKSLPNGLDVKCDSVIQFLKGFRSDVTRESYAKKLVQFLEWHDLTADGLLLMAQQKPRSVQRLIIDHIEERRDTVSGSTINQTVVSLKHFFEMNDADESISWKKISRIQPRVRKTGSDRAPTIQEIRQMLDAADLRTRCIILICASSGIRVGAFNDLLWGDLRPVSYGDGQQMARLLIYRGSVEEYVTFVSPECYAMLLKYREMREEAGEHVTAKSPLIRDSWDSNIYRKNKAKSPRVAVPLTSKTISNMMGKFLKRANMRSSTLQKSGHEFKQVHGFRKYFKTSAERTMKTIDVEKLMGHTENYYKPSEKYLLEQYVKAVPDITISEEEELRRTVKVQAVISDKKVGEIERENVTLQDRLAKLESNYDSLKEILQNVLIAKTK